MLSFFLCVLLVVYGISEDYEFIKALSWASGKLALKNDAAASMLSLSWKEEDFQLGIMTFAYQGVCCQLVHRMHSQLIVQVMRLSRMCLFFSTEKSRSLSMMATAPL